MEIMHDKSGPITYNPELNLDFSDSEIVEYIDRKVKEYQDMYSELKVKDRADRMVSYWKGEQDDKATKLEGEKRYINNIIYRDMNTRAQNATSKMPDIVVTSPQQAEDMAVRDQTSKVEDWLSIRLDSDVLRRLAQNTVIDNHLKLRGIWKYRYDHYRKDAIIERLRPEDVVLDATARIPEDGFTCDNMEFIGEWIEDSTANVIAMFPDKKDDLLAEIGRMAEKEKKPASSKVRYLQAWATMHTPSGEPKEIMACKYGDILLWKGNTPYWDDSETDMQFGIIPDAKLQQSVAALEQLALGIPMPQESPKPKRKNHFQFARKPYTVFSGHNSGSGPLDDTTVVEVSLPMQDIVNRRGNQISLINDWAVPKVVALSSALPEEKAANITRDPSEIIVLDSNGTNDVRAGLMTFSGEPASPALYSDLQTSIQAIDSLFATNPIHEATGESGLSKQISREGDLAAADNIAQTMVQRAVEEAANWLVQLAKIYFDEPHSITSAGPDKSMRSASISSELIPDDIQIVVRASSIDKATRRNMAMALVGSKAIDPLTLFEDLDYANPKEMAQRLVDFLNGPPSGYVKYLTDIGVNPGEPAGQQSEGVTPEPQQPPAIPPGPPAI